MEKLHPDWLTTGLLDTEYKQYILLAWLQKVKQEFRHTRLYPALADLIEQHRHLCLIASQREGLDAHRRGELTTMDFREMRLVYQQGNGDSALEQYIHALLEFAIPRLKAGIEEGKDLYEIVEEHLDFEPVGLLPLWKNEGYLFLYDEPRQEVTTYRFQRSWIERDDERLTQLEVERIEQFRKSMTESFEQAKLALIRRFSAWPNPATFMARSTLALPLQETLLPVAKRRLLRELAAA
jgi:hypothetical protein